MATPIPEYEDPKDLYAFFGLAFYKAQVLEQGLVNLVVALSSAGVEVVTADTLSGLFTKWDTKTLGTVLAEARTLFDLPEGLDDQLEEALRLRNYLAHSFFLEHATDLLSATGKRRMIDELAEIHSILSAADAKLDPVWIAAWQEIGLTNDMYTSAFASMVRESRR